MKGRKLLSIMLTCCMLVSQPMAEAFAEEGSEAVGVRVDMETDMDAETEEETEAAETETEPAEEKQAAELESVAETESESETGKDDNSSVEVTTETLTIEESETLLTNKDNPPAGSRIRVAVTAKGNYSGSISATYRIMEKGKDISKAKIQIKNQEYTGKPITITDSDQFKTASLKVGTGTKTLVFGSSAAEGVDFVAVPGSYENNTDKGTAKVTFQGVGQYGGYKTVTFTIGAKSIGTVWEGIWSKLWTGMGRGN